MKKGFRFLEHTADAYVEAYGDSLEEAFGSAGLGFTDVMTEVEAVKPESESVLVVEGQDEKALLYSWLEELLLEFELRGMIYSRFEVLSIKEAGEGFRLEVKAWGEKYDPKRHMTKVGIKAATYHQMEIDKEADAVTLRFILDI
jgi:SHS2 domain-containing protein